jgi:hypothetical protein
VSVGSDLVMVVMAVVVVMALVVVMLMTKYSTVVVKIMGNGI